MHTVGLACLVATANLSAATRVFAEARHPTSSVNLEKASSLCEMQPLRHQKIHQPSQEAGRRKRGGNRRELITAAQSVLRCSPGGPNLSLANGRHPRPASAR
ncbi:hypothetical protein An03g01020 [Aspergillus niger]|uniref:Secreted protein n=2 Tax=Aspergillus niger TaxID=5061 RepID=A2QFW5_ASPNC|nr:hypothetical protein An03g01020 [Aspergillus niger]CAK38075.1 hypothetical protein An03g01020 [Aspergillus niger]